ncbi:MAG TPA: RNA-binding transcriptional accessory protein [Anaerolineae bacterium]|nr:RNA-binding transcriptional accessory protein [Anaerolineae bacterium]HIQ05288.1 RNA-binding transcriptional accessory protein [Anaerolineae bacterium]
MSNEQRATSMPNFARRIATELELTPAQVTGAIELLDAGNTIPFIARYRKEATGGLDEVQLRRIEARLAYLRNLAARVDTVLRSIAEQGKLTPELEARIRAAATLQEVEDLYLPYRPKRRTRATIARERGLEPLAVLLLADATNKKPLPTTPIDVASSFLGDDVPTPEDALAGARDIVAEMVSDDADVRGLARRLTQEEGYLISRLASEEADPEGKYQLYHDFSAPLRTLAPHQLLAINRGEKEGALKVRLEAPEDLILGQIETRYIRRRSPAAAQVREAIEDGYDRLVRPAIERELRGGLTETADEHAIDVFATNLRNLLLQPPLRGKTVMGIDPGYRTGCKVAVVDPTGKYLDSTTIYPHQPQKRWAEAKATLGALCIRHNVDVIAIGNGTASRETESLVAELIGDLRQTGTYKRKLAYTIVSEAGASVYSASSLAREELPQLDVSMRGAVSIARRLQDPLAELVKIDPRSIGVGLYQHDVDQKQLTQALDAVVEDAVNAVGVDVNTASPALLRYVAGIGKKLAENIVAHRDEHGPFRSRAELKKVRGMGEKTFQQAAGFLRVPGSRNRLDETAIHPESYPVVRQLFDLAGLNGRERNLPNLIARFRAENDLAELAELLEVGEPTLADIFDALIQPGRDPRDELPGPVLRQDVLSIEDLREGMVLKGVVRNVVDFGAFVDIGVKQDGLVHVSEMAERYVRNPHAVVAVGDVVEVRVIKVDKGRGRISLSMKKPG